jgi:putative ABC transport system permease protein
MSGDDMFQLVDLDVTNAPARLDPTQVLESRNLATQLGMTVGDQVPLTISTQTQFLTVAGIFDRPFALLGEAVIDTSVLKRLTPSSYDLVAMVRIDQREKATTTAAIERLAASNGVESVLPPAQLISKRTEILRGFEQVIRWMLLFSVALAIIGVANTLQLSVNERRRELGLLRAVGGSASQVVRLVVVEALALSVVGVVAGTILGVGAAFAAVQALASVGLDQFRTPWLVVGGTALAAAIFGVVGAWMPARRAANADILDAIGDAEVDRPPLRTRLAFRSARPSSTLQDGTAPPDGREHQASTSPKAGGVPGPVEETMAARCYQCGNDPGDDDRCQVCGAAQIPEPPGIFSSRTDV